MSARAQSTSHALLLAALALLACDEKNQRPPVDAGVRADTTTDLRPVPLTVDFTVTDCPRLDPSKPQCQGPAPLTLSFVPITSGDITRFSWDFGDLSRSQESLPSHTYTLPGSYDVSVAGTPGGASRMRKEYVVVTANALGDACDVERQCATGLRCVCGAAAQCPTAFARGHCTADCNSATCPESAVCADLGLGLPPSQAEGDLWRTRSCLRRCSTQTDCPTGRRCRLVPVAGAPDRWERACFYGFPAEAGAACRGPTGLPQNDLCLGGLCADLGALGMCSLDCSTRPCPSGTGCVAFNDGRRVCLRPCTGDSACRDDPLLACVPSGSRGPLGFTVVDPSAGATFCAPKPCASDATCAPAGICLGAASAAHCARRVD